MFVLSLMKCKYYFYKSYRSIPKQKRDNIKRDLDSHTTTFVPGYNYHLLKTHWVRALFYIFVTCFVLCFQLLYSQANIRMVNDTWYYDTLFIRPVIRSLFNDMYIASRVLELLFPVSYILVFQPSKRCLPLQL